MSNDEISAEPLADKLCQVVEGKMEQVISFPIDELGCDIECKADASLLKDRRDDILKVAEHFIKCHLKFGREEPANHDVIKPRHGVGFAKNVGLEIANV